MIYQKAYNLEDRTLEFSKRLLKLAKHLPKDDVNIILKKQFVRSGTSVGANYREANDAVSDKDLLHRMRISRKEAKETTYWLELVIFNNEPLANQMQELLQESIEITKILSSIIKKRTKINTEQNILTQTVVSNSLEIGT